MIDRFAARIERDTVHVDGPDAFDYLQGQFSQDLAPVTAGASVWTLLLDPSGKVDAWLRVTRAGGQEFVLDADAGSGDLIVARLRRFLLRTKAEIGDATRTPCLAVRGVPLPGPRAGLPIAWPFVAGYDQLGASANPPDGVDVVGADRYELARIRCGAPANGHELTGATIPAEAGQWLIDASVSFTKGCFTGQELVARIDSRGGNVPRPIRGLVVEGIEPVPAGADVVAANNAGSVTSSAIDPDAGVTLALAPLSRAVAPGTAVTVHGRAAEVREFPLA